MPKTTMPPLPLQGIFGLAKPSGPTTMSIVTRLKPLFSSSRLFVEQDKLDSFSASKQKNMKEAYPGPTLPGELTGKDRNKGKGKGKRTNWKKLSRNYIKIGSGGTLDPLADGVLIIGIGSGTKDLSQFLHCTKTYRTTGLLGCETDSYDSEGAIARLAPWKHVTRLLLLSNLNGFRGEILQTPPIYSALKIEGRPLYEYARQNIPLPRPVEPRKVTISKLELTGYTESPHHPFKYPSKRLTPAEVEERNKVLKLVASDPASGTVTEVESQAVKDSRTGGEVEVGVIDHGPGGEAVSEQVLSEGRPLPGGAEVVMDKSSDEAEIPPTFELEMTVSSGTYVRSVVHDLGISVGSVAHVVVLTRIQQGQFVLGSVRDPASPSSPTTADAPGEGITAGLEGWPCVDWGILEKALLKWEADEEIEVDEDGWAEWELEILNKWPKKSVSQN
ncbi:hypothetical protein M408DRAFT_197395 [Serendipita vermifera MAFF 305830]|uniref:tRNA pseudouridine(55) synthase n=1 Tax=Serendipita vermifera MAFF 305830 TaxID=933852 RepID=A0A0C3ANQ9_SERVB|nr:hypothetical protein M408DRAFT_197395 [Serendipita vermifera MAFF 305830]